MTSEAAAASPAEPKKEPEVKMSEHVRNLADLLREGKADEAKRLLMRVAGLLPARDDSGRSTAHFAAVGGCLPILQFAVNMDSFQADAPDDMGWTPLMISSSAGRTDVVRYLLSLPQVSVSHKNKNGQTALHYAASKNHKEIAHILLEAGADVNSADRLGATPLHRAASQGHEAMVYMLLTRPKIRIDARNSEGNTALFLACEEDREDVAIALAAKGAMLDVKNRDEKSPLDVVRTSALRTKLKAAEQRAASAMQQ